MVKNCPRTIASDWGYLICPFLAFGVGIHLFQSGWVALILYHLLITVALLLNRERWRPERLFKGFSLVWVLVHLLGCVAAYLIFCQVAVSKEYTVDLKGVGRTGLGFVIYFLIVNPVLEEVFWRDFLASKSRMLSLGDVIFGAFHFLILQPFLPLNYILGFIVGLVGIAYLWRQLRWRYQGLLIPWLAHLMGDLLFVVLVVKLTN